MLPFINNYFKSNIYYAIGTYSLILSSNKKTKFFFNQAKKYFDSIIYFSSFTKSIIDKNINFKKNIKKKIINLLIHLEKKMTYKVKKFKNKTILCIGELKRRKGYDLLVKVL